MKSFSEWGMWCRIWSAMTNGHIKLHSQLWCRASWLIDHCWFSDLLEIRLLPFLETWQPPDFTKCVYLPYAFDIITEMRLSNDVKIMSSCVESLSTFVRPWYPRGFPEATSCTNCDAGAYSGPSGMLCLVSSPSSQMKIQTELADSTCRMKYLISSFGASTAALQYDQRLNIYGLKTELVIGCLQVSLHSKSAHIAFLI